MIALGNILEGMLTEEAKLELEVQVSAQELTTAEAVVVDILMAMYKRQRDGIMLSVRTSNG